MASHPHSPIAPEPDQELKLVQRAQQGDRAAFGSLVEPWRKPLFGYIYRMVTQRQDAEDLLQDVFIRVLENLREYRGEARFKSWLFGIATHVCLDHLRSKKRWRVEAQLIGEQEAKKNPENYVSLQNMMAQPGFTYETREHIAFCFSCIARTLSPEEQAAVMLKEVLGFTAEEGAGILRVSEPIFRHRLSDARARMTQAFDGLCALINKTGLCQRQNAARSVIFASPMNSFLSAFFGEALQLKRPKRCVLRCDVQSAAKGKLSRAPSQRFFSRNARHGRIVILLGKMRENEMARSPVKHFAIRQKVAHRRV